MGSLRLTALAWSKNRLGHVEVTNVAALTLTENHRIGKTKICLQERIIYNMTACRWIY